MPPILPTLAQRRGDTNIGALQLCLTVRKNARLSSPADADGVELL